MNRLWKIISSIGVVLGLVASGISIWTVTKIDKIEKERELAEAAGGWEIKLEIIGPEEGAEFSGGAVRISGNIEFRTEAIDALQNNVKLVLDQNKVELSCYIRSLSSKNNFWYQSKSLIESDNRFTCHSFFEQNKNATSKIGHQIVALIIPKKETSKNLISSELPFYYTSSNTVAVKSIH